MQPNDGNRNQTPPLTEAERKVLDRIKEKSKLKKAQQIVRKLANSPLLFY